MKFTPSKQAISETGAYYTYSNIPLSELGAFVLVPTTGGPQYTVGSVHVLARSSTAWSAARVVPCASNDLSGIEYAAHPDGTALTPAANLSIGLSLDYAMFGFYVSVAEAGVVADILIVMKP